MSSQSENLIMSMGINHFEQISLLITNFPHTLGLPWLQKHNPQVDWVTNNILQWRVGCEASCLNSSQVLAATSVEGLPSCYSSFADFFL